MKHIFSCRGAIVAALFSGATAYGYSIEIRDAPIVDVIRLLHSIENSNVVLPDNHKGMVTASFPSIDLKSALEAILSSQQLGAIQKGEVTRISTRQDLEDLGEDLITENSALKYAKAANVEGQAKSLLSKRGTVFIDERTNSITYRDTPRYIRNVRELISIIDRKDQQVLIEVRIVKATTNFARDFGVQWGATANQGGVKVGGLPNVGSNAAGTRSLMTNLLSSGLSSASGPAAGMAINIGEFLDIQLAMAESQGTASLLSRPSIVTANNQPAQIRSGTTFYIQGQPSLNISSSTGGSPGTAGGSASTGSSLQQIVAGITMEVTPQISPNNTINLAVNVTQSDADAAGGIAGIPAINDNTAKTSISLMDGETTVIGGLIRSTKSSARKGIPWLMSIPILGALFGSNADVDNKSELLIFLTPTIIKSALNTLDGYSRTDPITREFLPPEEELLE